MLKSLERLALCSYTMQQRTQPTTSHYPVLLHESLDALAVKESNTVVDATLGGLGHSTALLTQLGSEGTFIGLDVDGEVITRAEEVFKKSSSATHTGTHPVTHVVKENFRNLDRVLTELNISAVDAFLFDLGFSSIQLESSGRGISFQKEEPLLMTLTDTPKEGSVTAQQIVNEWSEEHITTILRGYGEEQFAKRIAQALVEKREVSPIQTTSQLKEIVEEAVPSWYRRQRIHPATKTFQALRIAVNDEIEAITEALEKAFSFLKPQGRIAVITFHSIEDRRVKRVFQEWQKSGRGEMKPRKPIRPTREEIRENPRSRSAKLRVFISN